MEHRIWYSIGVLIGLAVFLLPIYGYFSFCFWKIAKKTKTQPYWLAWIPVGRVFLICRMCDLSHWHAIALTVIAIMPHVPWLLFWAYLTWILFHLPEALEIDSGAQFLMLIPIVNWFYIGYLAFKKESKPYFQ